MAAKYNIQAVGSETFNLFEDGNFLCSFTRLTFRDTLDNLCRGSNWVGSILRLLNKKFPLPHRSDIPFHTLAKSPFALESEYIENLKARGFRIFKPSASSDNEMIDFLEKRGFIVEGLKSNNSFHSTLYDKHELDHA